MTTMVCFDAAGASYCVPVEATRAVRPTTGIVGLPAPGVDIAGIVPGDPPLTVIAPLGGGGEQILVMESGDTTFGLLVDTVTGLRRIVDSDIHAAPAGQEHSLIRGTIDNGGALIMVADAAALAGLL